MTSTTTTRFEFINGTQEASGFDKVHEALSKLDDNTLITVVEDTKKPTKGATRTQITYTFKVGGKASSSNVMLKGDAVKYLAGKAKDLSILRYAPINVTSLTEENLMKVANSIIDMYAVKTGDRAQAEEELVAHLAAASGIKTSQGFSSSALNDIAKVLYSVAKTSDLSPQQRMRALQAIKTATAAAKKAVKDAGYLFENIATGAAMHFFVQSKVRKNGAIEDKYSLRSSKDKKAPTYKDDGKEEPMRLNGDGLFYIDPRSPKESDSETSTEGVVSRKARGAVTRGDDEEYLASYKFLKEQKNYATPVLDSLTHALVKQTAKENGFNFRALA